MAQDEKTSMIERIKNELDELESQLNKGTSDFKNTFSEQKDKFSNMVKKIHGHFEDAEKMGESKVGELTSKARNLLDTLESDYDISYTEYEEKPHDLKRAIEVFEKSMKEHFEQLGNDASEAKEKLHKEYSHGIDIFKNELSIQQARVGHSKDKALEEFEEWKSNRLEDVKELKNKIDENLDSSKDKFGLFNEEILESYKHLKSAFSKLL